MMTFEMVDQSMVTVTMIEWEDAATGQQELAQDCMEPAKLYCCGFILKETETSITVGLETVVDKEETETSRMWLCIPKGMIKARTDHKLDPPKKLRRKK